MAGWNITVTIRKHDDRNARRADARSRRNTPAGMKHGRQHRTRV